MAELIWDGKFKDKKKPAPVCMALPFQTIETINESTKDCENRLGSLFNQKQGTGERDNRLIWDDEKYLLPSLLPEFASKANLSYIVPPFDTGANFSFKTKPPTKAECKNRIAAIFTKKIRRAGKSD